MQISLFDLMYEKYKIKKPIRLIELFAGYGSQALALKYLGVEFTHWRICEWAVKSIQAYKDIHFSEDNNDYSQLATKEQIIKYLAKKGISANYNEPMSYEQIKRLNEKQLRTIYNNIVATKNLVNISQVKAKDLDICDTKNYDYIMTYSFPCQDLSLAGKQKGMGKNSGTRSGLLWEVERILDECSDIGNMPQVLLMENVPEVIGKSNIKDLQKWIEKLESLGYSNYVECLNSKDYGVPQNRNRCFMISILGEYSYKFPLPFKLKLRLKDLLESNVDEKYYLSDKMVNYITADNEKWTGNNNKKLINKMENHGTVTAVVEQSNELIKYGSYYTWKDKKGNYNTQCNRAANENECALTIACANPGKVATEKNLNYNCNLRIRKLTPKECFRLMGVKDEDYEKVAKNQSNASLYHLAGDSIVTNCVMAIFKNLL